MFSFSQGDIFLVEANINDDWLWVRSMRNRHESGLIPVALVEKTVGACTITILTIQFVWYCGYVFRMIIWIPMREESECHMMMTCSCFYYHLHVINIIGGLIAG